MAGGCSDQSRETPMPQTSRANPHRVPPGGALTRTRAESILAAALIGSALACTAAQRSHAAANPPPALPCGDAFAFHVLLDEQGFSPGEIDGKLGSNLSHALAALQAARGLQPTGEADC